MTTLPPTTDSSLAALSAQECRALLGLSAVGRIAFIADSLPVVLPVNYRLMSDELGIWIVLRTRSGNIIDQAPPQVAFEIDGVNYDNRTGWSVLVQGALHHLDHNEVELFRQRFDPKPWPDPSRAAWLAIKPHTITGRRLLAAESEWELSSDAYL